MTGDNIADLYVPGAPSAGGAVSDVASSAPGDSGVAPAEASGTDLPVPIFGEGGPLGGGGGPGFIGLPGGYTSSGPGSVGLPGGYGGGGGGSGGGGGGGGGGSTPPVMPPGTGGGTPPPVAGVPEPATWTMMLIGFGAIGGHVRRERRNRAAAPTA